MRTNQILAAEFAVGAAVMSWNALKRHWWPWPASLARVGLGFAVISLLAVPVPELAVTLGAGFLLVDVVKMLSSKTASQIGIPPSTASPDNYAVGPYANSYLAFGKVAGGTTPLHVRQSSAVVGSGGATQAPAAPTPGSGTTRQV
jgi:hypothetical protein